MAADDWPDVESIFYEGIRTGNATFASAPPTWGEFDAGKIAAGRFVAVQQIRGAEPAIVGWIAGSPTSSREAYKGVVEHSVYVTKDAAGHGIGSQLLHACPIS